MHFLFLGTGAADWVKPEVSGEFRRYSSMLADGEILLDCPACALDALAESKISLKEINYHCITHSHRDHFEVGAIKKINAARRDASLPPLSIYAHLAIADYLRKNDVDAVGVMGGQSFFIGGYNVTTLPANHTPGLAGEKALHYLFSGKGVQWLYATDGAWMPYEAWDILRHHSLDALIIDATIGDGHAGDYRIFEHNSLPLIRIMVDTMQGTKALKPEAPVLLTHMARTLHPDHKTLVQSLEAPFVAAYDGMIYTKDCFHQNLTSTQYKPTIEKSHIHKRGYYEPEYS
jgi:hypothetical protein